MTYGMTKEQLIAANTELIKALQAKEGQIREFDARVKELEDLVRAYENCEPMTIVNEKRVPIRFARKARESKVGGQ